MMTKQRQKVFEQWLIQTGKKLRVKPESLRHMRINDFIKLCHSKGFRVVVTPIKKKKRKLAKRKK